ncbi:hypothetical protein P3L10_020364 [Capsicum annuum]
MKGQAVHRHYWATWLRHAYVQLLRHSHSLNLEFLRSLCSLQLMNNGIFKSSVHRVVTYVAQTLQRYRQMHVGSSKSSAFLEDPHINIFEESESNIPGEKLAKQRNI